MGLTDNLCMNCFEKLTSGSVCRNCGFDNDSVTDMLYLSRKTVLAKRYIVGNVIAKDGSCVTYIGYDAERNAAVSIHEFLPGNIANRLEGNYDVHVRERYKKSFAAYKQAFLKLWKTLKGLNSLSAVIPVLDIFKENETAYAVCEKMNTVSLRDFLIRNTDNNILWDKARLMFMPILTTLERLHENGIIHGAINPDNLVLCKDGKVRLTGFSISTSSDLSEELGFNPVSGYSALEQYHNNHKVCPATDIYAFSACIYRSLVGTNPPEAPAREINDKLMIPNSIAEKIPAHVIRALGGGLQIYPENRIQDVEDFRELLSAAPSVVAQSASASAPVQQQKDNDEELQKVSKEKPAKKKNKAIIIAAVLAVIAIIAAAVYVIKFSGVVDPPENPSDSPSGTAMVTVPDFCTAGYTESDVQNQALWNSQFKIEFDSDFSKDVEEGVIFRQSVDANSQVAQGTPIVLTVSRGIETSPVPDVGGLNKDEAIKTLEEAGFKVTVMTVYNDGTNAANTVKTSGGMAPEEDTVYAKGEEVIIQVYGEPVTESESVSQD